jgi:hypothetical protein
MRGNEAVAVISRDGKRCDPHPDHRLVVVFLGAIILLRAIPGISGTCLVPSASYQTIQSAVDVATCTEIVLTKGAFMGGLTIDRPLEIRGVSSAHTRVLGSITVQGAATTATLTGFTIGVGSDPPNDGLVVTDGAEVVPDDVVITTLDSIFFDGFEPGNTTAWSSTRP